MTDLMPTSTDSSLKMKYLCSSREHHASVQFQTCQNTDRRLCFTVVALAYLHTTYQIINNLTMKHFAQVL